MKYTPPSIDVNLRPEGSVVHLDSLFAALASLTDRRDARGLRYRLVTVLLYVLLAKLAGEDHLRGIAQSVLINLDGKALRGTIPAGKTKGVHLLAAYLPEEGWVLFQVEVSRKEYEIPAAMRILRRLERRTLTASSALADYLHWPYGAQVFRIERRFLRLRDGKLMEEVK